MTVHSLYFPAICLVALAFHVAPVRVAAQSGGDDATAIAPPAGLFVCRGPSPTPEKEVDFPFIDGWLVRPGWNRVEPKEGEFDFSYIDAEIALAKRLKKKITLCVLGGPQTPAWVFEAGAPEFDYSMPFGRIRSAKIPPLWNEVYLQKWTALIRAFGEKYGDNETVLLVHITGATANGLEMQLPFMRRDRERWQMLGFTPEKVIAAWKPIIDTFAEAFPGKPLDIDIHPVLGTDRVAEEVAAYGSARLGRRFGIFSGWLSGRSPEQDRHHAGMLALAEKYGPKGFAAFQMIASESRTPQQFAEGGIKTAINQGLSWNAHYFEIWELDAMNPELHAMLTEMAVKVKK
ncbi:MAG TPA: beta-galactosidase [Pirellulales bacterium]|nr:beta-galactosidase [Pirellulales bacterium]